ncbi:unnamed protein product [Amoebophrya sp. A25]|nr:unnamed protein product [Amoebophrya sp. A25]|eukprot:GSA25T00015546001.1
MNSAGEGKLIELCCQVIQAFGTHDVRDARLFRDVLSILATSTCTCPRQMNRGGPQGARTRMPDEKTVAISKFLYTMAKLGCFVQQDGDDSSLLGIIRHLCNELDLDIRHHDTTAQTFLSVQSRTRIPHDTALRLCVASAVMGTRFSSAVDGKERKAREVVTWELFRVSVEQLAFPGMHDHEEGNAAAGDDHLPDNLRQETSEKMVSKLRTLTQKSASFAFALGLFHSVKQESATDKSVFFRKNRLEFLDDIEKSLGAPGSHNETSSSCLLKNHERPVARLLSKVEYPYRYPGANTSASSTSWGRGGNLELDIDLKNRSVVKGPLKLGPFRVSFAVPVSAMDEEDGFQNCVGKNKEGESYEQATISATSCKDRYMLLDCLDVADFYFEHFPDSRYEHLHQLRPQIREFILAKHFALRQMGFRVAILDCTRPAWKDCRTDEERSVLLKRVLNAGTGQ